MSKKLAAKASLIQLPPTKAPAQSPAAAPELPAKKTDEEPHQAAGNHESPAPVAASGPSAAAHYLIRPSGPSEAVEARPRTAPGSMAVFMAAQSSAVKEAQELKIKLSAFEGAVPVRMLDPIRVRASVWANRHADSLASKEFEDLRSDIAAAGSNVQPICVRPLQDGSDPLHEYELVFGHRRHRACLELGLPVRAMIAEIDDQGLFEAMERENRARKNLSAWEQGTMYRRALDGGLYSSQRKLAEAINVDLSLVSKSLTLARLPEAVVGAFTSPLDIQFRWAQPLSEALQRDPDGLVARAKALAPRRGSMSSKEVLDALLRAEDGTLNGSTPVSPQRLGKAGQGVTLTRDTSGRAHLRFDPGVLTTEGEASLLAWLESSLKLSR